MGIFWRQIDKTKLMPQFVADVEKLLGESKHDWYVTYGYRTLLEQELLHNIFLKGGPKAAPPGMSPHNFGLAIDIVLDVDPDKPGLQPSWDIKLAAWIWLFAIVKLHPRLKSGILFRDGGHLERYEWQEHRHWKNA